MADSMAAAPDAAGVLDHFERVKNWGRWGKDDQKGTLNLITEPHRVAAAGLVRQGRAVSMARDINTQYGAPDSNAQMFWVVTGQCVDCPPEVPTSRYAAGNVASAVEYIGMVFHGANTTHLDTQAHLFWKGRVYNDRPSGLGWTA